MKFFFDLLPVILFFVAFKFAGIYVATGIAIATTIAQVIWMWLRHRKVEPMQWVSLAIIVVFGGATMLLHDETFIKWKPTALYWLFSITLFVAELIFDKNLIRAMMEKQMALPDPLWRAVNFSWALFFLAMGALNLVIAYHYSTDTWVNFKLFGGMGLMVVFIVVQSLWLSKYIKQDE
ncbi:septation protein A [Pandoraea sp. XJJ-1]|uniref:Inner membrane-spanning protein YciB n=1 Tax=Pandoraea cepalis TaxID=2508294 RepID=A0A5E4TVZ0_9BURK|nr:MULTISPECIES: septation protein A [Pandoraea]MDN4574350.1 septation protein A [Pandoraea cepalis]MDN4579853.1 septation protein A [Pandoraea cepalis]OJY20973.1 MAG: septation protein A [Pandoraea sp. 64-18]QBC32048.1 septation protein A [Pandoraea sp. XY-2]WAL80823.1 septation protein A [Pandoraea sp. XJJ-1]